MSSIRKAGAYAAVFAIAGCGGNSASPPGATTVVPPSSSKAQLAVGTANLFGLATGLNVTSTLRTPSGNSVLLNSPTLTGPFVVPATAGTAVGSTGATIATGPSSTEIKAGGEITSTPQVTPGTVPAPSTFGIRGGVFAGGFQPSNADNLGTVRSTPYTEPSYDALSANDPTMSGNLEMLGDPNAFIPYGGPPAFDPNGDGQGARDGTFDASIPGFNEFITTFEGVTVAPGTYNLGIVIPTTTTSTTITATTTLAAVAKLGTLAAPKFVSDGNGGGTFAVVLPAGVTDGLLNIYDAGPAKGSSCYINGAPPAYFTIHVTGSGTYTLPDRDGVGSPTQKSPTICTAAENAALPANAGIATTGDSIAVQLIGADYPIYASNYLFNQGQQTPTIKGPAGNDITISPVSNQVST